MAFGVVGQRCMSEREPELGLGVVASVEHSRIGIAFPATGEKRLYALGTPVLKRVQFRAGETIVTREGVALLIESVAEEAGVLVYAGQGRRVREDAISDVTSVSLPQERLMAGQVDPSEVWDLRFRALQAQWRFRQSDVRGFLGGRLELIPHQFYILQEVSSRQIPRVLLADEVGLGKTIEACLILQRLLAVGKARRVLILVPESLTHQWFVELLRRFNLWFSIYDEDRCLACEQSDPGENPFLTNQLALCSVGLLAGNKGRREQAVAAGWDVVVVDEAHHLEWTPERVSAEYTLVEQLAQRCPGLLLLTATPMQLGLAGHFARLRLLDPDRYDDFGKFQEEAASFGAVAGIAEKIIEQKALKPKDHAVLKEIFNQDPERLGQLLDALAQGRPGARAALLKTLLDQHGTGRVVFRNTRATMTGFPKRKFCPAPLTDERSGELQAPTWRDGDNPSGREVSPALASGKLSARIARELQAEETGNDASIHYSFKDDPRIDWLVALLKKHRPAKVLLICKSQRKVAAIESALQEKISVKVGLFHEGLPLIHRDRNAAWFAEPDGAQLLLCSEIGSEGRNFQFAHHLVLFDLPLNPGLLEQRIGRLDRIGQTQTIRIHVPYIAGSSEEAVLEWYHRGLDAIEAPLHGGNDYQNEFKERLLALALAYGRGGGRGRKKLEEFIAETVLFRKALSLKLKKGRDRLLELNSFNRDVAARVVERIRAVDADPFLRNFLIELLDHFGVRIKEHEEGDVFLDPSHAYVESFPSIPHEGMLATFDRQRAIVREDIRFISPDHSLVQDAVDLLIDSRSGTSAFGFIESRTPNLLLETIFVLEAMADSRWHVEQFLAPMPVRVVVDLRGNDLSGERDAASLAAEVEDGTIQRFLERPGFNAGLLKTLLDHATERAEVQTRALKSAAQARASAALSAERQRLIDLRKINNHVRPEEIELAQEQLQRVDAAIEQARLRLDSIRLIVEGPDHGE
ncbi:MAG: RNA polymerase-associated protein RapA [Verrucomicrobia bacterium]|nr:RNA polymerase-associated protein RapA [Verrucomicrobiota bacterium]